MQLAYAIIVGGPANYVVIYDEAASSGQPSVFDTKAIAFIAQPEWHPKHKITSQSEDLFTLPNQAISIGKFRQTLGNVICNVSARFIVPYKTRQDAMASVRQWESLQLQPVVFKLTQDLEIQYYPNAVVNDVDSDLQGTTVVHQIAFESNKVTSVAPQ